MIFDKPPQINRFFQNPSFETPMKTRLYAHIIWSVKQIVLKIHLPSITLSNRR